VFSDEVFAGKTYKVRVRAHNVNGWGDFSPILIIKSTGIPGIPQPPTTFIQNLNVRISWTDPSNNFEAITSYQVLISLSDYQTMREIPLYCDGSNAVVVALRSC
jgi:hypothetical protein